MSLIKLTPKQQKFVDEYLVDLNATQAAIRAGYSVKTANEQGTQNLAKLSIANAIQLRSKAIQQRTEITQEEVMKNIDLIRADAMQKIPDKDGNLVMLNHNAALKATELQGKRLVMWTEKVEHTGSVTITASPLDEKI
jgi:phage terminase small subunit